MRKFAAFLLAAVASALRIALAFLAAGVFIVGAVTIDGALREGRLVLELRNAGTGVAEAAPVPAPPFADTQPERAGAQTADPKDERVRRAAPYTGRYFLVSSRYKNTDDRWSDRTPKAIIVRNPEGDNVMLRIPEACRNHFDGVVEGGVRALPPHFTEWDRAPSYQRSEVETLSGSDARMIAGDFSMLESIFLFTE